MVETDPVAPTSEDIEKPVTAVVTLGDNWKSGTAGNIAQSTVEFGDGVTKSVTIKTKADDTATATVSLNVTEYNKLFGTEYTSAEYKPVNTVIELTRSDSFDAKNETQTVDVTIVATIKEGGKNGVAAEAAVLGNLPTTIEVEDGDGNLVERTVESAKAVVNGKTFTEKAKNFDELVSKVNKELEKMAEAGKSALAEDVVVTLNMAEKEATDDVVNKPHIEVAEDDKVMVDYRSLHRQHRQELVHQPGREIHRRR